MVEEKNEKKGKESKTVPSPNGKRRWLIRICGVGLLILALTIGIPYLLHALSHESTDDAFIDGTIVWISPRISGTVTKVLTDDNQWVRAGEPLVALDPGDCKVRYDAATAAVKAAEASVVAAEAMVKTAEAATAAAGSHRDQAKAQLVLAEATLSQHQAEADSKKEEHQRNIKDLVRARQMAKTDTISEQGLDHALAAERMSASDVKAAEYKIETQKAAVQQAKSALAAAEDYLRQACAQTDAQRAQALKARADVDRAAAELEQSALQLSYTKIIAPVDGYVTKKSVEQGAFVQTGQMLMALVPSEVWVTANFKETQLTHMLVGQPATIKVDTFPDVTFTGHVASFQRGTGARFSLLPPENATGNFIKVVQRVPVKIIFDKTDQLKRYPLALGLSVQPEVDIRANGVMPGTAVGKNQPSNFDIAGKSTGAEK